MPHHVWVDLRWDRDNKSLSGNNSHNQLNTDEEDPEQGLEAEASRHTKGNNALNNSNNNLNKEVLDLNGKVKYLAKQEVKIGSATETFAK